MILIFSVLAKRLAGKSVSDMLSATSNLNQSASAATYALFS